MTLNKVWHAAHGPAHVAAHASGREYAPRRAAVRAALSVLLLVLVLLSSPTDALAASNPSVVWQSGTNYVVSPTSNGFDAALAAIGLYSVRPRLTTDMLAKLSNESTGGDFYDLAQKFQSVASAEPPWLNSNGSNFVQNATAYGITATQCKLYGRDNVMWSDSVTSSDIANAKRDFNIIQNGGSLGGGGGSVVDDGYIYFSGGMKYVTYNASVDVYRYPSSSPIFTISKQYHDANGTPYQTVPVTIRLSLSNNPASGALSTFVERYSPDEYEYLAMANISSGSINIRAYKTDGIITSTSDNGDVSSEYISSGSISDGGSLNSSISCSVTYTSGMFDFVPTTSLSGSTVTNPSTSYTYSIREFGRTGGYSELYLKGRASVGSGGGGEVINRWPQDQITGHPVDEPVVPTPPVYDPITYTNPTDDPLPTPPPETPYTPTTPIVTTDPTNTTPADYTPWLSAILNELRNFHRDAVGLGNNIMDVLATHCTHITTTIMDETEWLYNQLKAQIRAGVQAILDGLDQNCTEMMNYLQDLAEWLADQLQFTFNIDNSYNPEISVPAYDDGSVVAWLQRIYNAIRNIKGPTIGTPVTEKDIEDGFDWWAWLLSLLDQLFDNVISQTVGEIESFLEEFRNLFPLSIPWDMIAILTMYAGTPTTPEVTLTFPAIASLGLPEYDLEIDLEPFDNAAYTIRQAEQILFAFYLLFKTQWLLNTLKSATDAAGEFVEGLLT